MTDLIPCLAGCDAALAEAELLLAMLGAENPARDDLGPVQRSVEALRREVDRLRGIKVVPSRRRGDPFSIDIAGGKTPWPDA